MKEQYEKLTKKYDLPDYSELKKYFSIEGIDEEDDILKELIKKIHSKIESYASIVESLIQPDSSISSMHEASNLDKMQKKNLSILFAKLMKIERNLALINLDFEEESTSKVIKTSVENWKILLPELKNLLTNLKDCWEKENIEKEERGYFG